MAKKKLNCKTIRKANKKWVACFPEKGTKAKPKAKTVKKKAVIKKPKAKPVKKKAIIDASAGGRVLLGGGGSVMRLIGSFAITKEEKARREKLRRYNLIFPEKNMVNVKRLLGMYGLMDTFFYRIPEGADGANGRKLKNRVYNRAGMKRMTREIGSVMDDQMRTLSNHKYIKEVMSFNDFMNWFYEVGYYMKNIDKNPNAKISIHTPFYDTPDFKKGEGLLKSFSSREFLLKMPELYARFGGVPNATPKLINGNIDLRMKTTKKGIQASYDEALGFLKNVHKHKRIR